MRLGTVNNTTMPIRITFLLLMFSCLTPAFALAQAGVEWRDSTTFDFGDIAHKKPVKHTFVFTNTGDVPLHIQNVREGCGCTTPDWGNDPILPGETGEIQVEYDAAKAGYFHQTMRVYFKEIRRAERLYVEGFVLETE